MYRIASQKVHDNRPQQYQGVANAAPCVEQQTGQKEQCILIGDFPAQGEQEKHNREEQEEKGEGTENHNSNSSKGHLFPLNYIKSTDGY